jgi:hypothetical protein
MKITATKLSKDSFESGIIANLPEVNHESKHNNSVQKNKSVPISNVGDNALKDASSMIPVSSTLKYSSRCKSSGKRQFGINHCNIT